MPEPKIHELFESKTGSWQYIVADPARKVAIIIDPVLDYDPASATFTTSSADELLAVVEENGYKVDMILETHAHADHITAASYIQHRLTKAQGIHDRPLICIGKRIKEVQKLWGYRYGIPVNELDQAFDKLFDDDEQFFIGDITASAIHLPGHTPDLVGYRVGNNVFVGDSIFNVDLGSARADFPGGSAEKLYASGRKLLALPDEVNLWVGHDYPPQGLREPTSCVKVGQHRKENKHLMDGISESDFVATRQERDSTLAEPRLLHQALQMNIRGGKLPQSTGAGLRMLHIPLKLNEVETW